MQELSPRTRFKELSRNTIFGHGTSDFADRINFRGSRESFFYRCKKIILSRFTIQMAHCFAPVMVFYR